MKNKKSLSRLICFVIVISGIMMLNAGCQNNPFKKHSNDQSIVDTDKFSIAVPAGWKHFTKQASGFNVLFLMGPTVDNFKVNLNIIAESTQGDSLDEYFKVSRENLVKANMVLDGSGDFDINGEHGKYSTSSFTYQGQDIATKTYMFIKDGVAYVLTGSCLVSQKNIYRPVFDNTVKTFQLK